MPLHRTVLPSSLIALVLTAALHAQSAPAALRAPSTPDEPHAQSTPKKPEITRLDLQPLELSYGARVARAFQYQFGLVEQFGTVTGVNGSLLPTPEHYLIQHSLKFQFSELFLTSSDFAKILTAYTTEMMATPDSKKFSIADLCPKSSALECIADSGGWWKRALSGVAVTFSLSER